MLASLLSVVTTVTTPGNYVNSAMGIISSAVGVRGDFMEEVTMDLYL